MSTMKMSFSVRRKQAELDAHTPIQIGRAASQRGGRPVTRTLISGPVALVSTTNMLSYNAPDIAGTKPVEHRDVNSSSSEESDGSGNSVHSHETDPTDMSSAESSPISAEPEPNHLSQYFKADDSMKRSPQLDASPRLPRRAQSHSKRAHEALSRKRSVQRASSVSRTRASVDMFSSAPPMPAEKPREAPFVKELAQLDAVAEEFTATARSEADTDTIWMKSRGLACFAAADYLEEIGGLVNILLDHKSPRVADFSGWF